MTDLLDAASPSTVRRDPPPGRHAGAAAVTSFVVLVGLIAYQGGRTQGGASLLLGFAAMFTLMSVAGLLGWWLFASRIPSRATDPGTGRRSAASAATGAGSVLPQVVAFATGIAGMLLTAGSAWDAAWHRRFGTQLVLNDFFWPPHLVIYGSMALLGCFSLLAVRIAFRGSGGLRRRVRAMPVVGVIGLVAAYVGASGPSDLLWHKAYGVDISAWSLPHVVLAVLIALVVLCGAAAVADPVARQTWRGPGAIRLRDLLCLLILTVGTAPMLLVFTGDYSGQALPGGVEPFGSYLRPDFWYPVTMSGLGVMFSAIVASLLRRVGAATLWAVGLVTVQAVMLTLFDGWGQPFASALLGHLLLVPPAIAVDLWLARRVLRRNAPGLAAGGVPAGVTAVAVTLLAIRGWTSYPVVSAGLVVTCVLLSALLGCWAGWFGSIAGTALARLVGMAPVIRLEPKVYRGAGLAVVAALLLLVGYVAVSPPPDTLCRQSGSLCLLNAGR